MTSDHQLTTHLEDRGVIAVAGEDRKTFLQGLITNDMAGLNPDQPVYAALLTPQGKYLHDFLLFEDGERILMDVEVSRLADLLRRLTLYRLRARVTTEDLSASHAVIVVWGNTATPDVHLKPDPRLATLGLRGIVPRNAMPELTASTVDYDRHRLVHGVPDGSRDLELERTLILEGNLDLLNGVSFTKGCYVGQELTARMNYRGKVRKRLLPVDVDGPLPAPGTSVTDGSREIGTLRSGLDGRAIALLRIEDITFGEAYACGDAKVTPVRPAWLPESVLVPKGNASS